MICLSAGGGWYGHFPIITKIILLETRKTYTTLVAYWIKKSLNVLYFIINMLLMYVMSNMIILCRLYPAHFYTHFLFASAQTFICTFQLI